MSRVQNKSIKITYSIELAYNLSLVYSRLAITTEVPVWPSRSRIAAAVKKNVKKLMVWIPLNKIVSPYITG